MIEVLEAKKTTKILRDIQRRRLVFFFFFSSVGDFSAVNLPETLEELKALVFQLRG